MQPLQKIVEMLLKISWHQDLLCDEEGSRQFRLYRDETRTLELKKDSLLDKVKMKDFIDQIEKIIRKIFGRRKSP